MERVMKLKKKTLYLLHTLKEKKNYYFSCTKFVDSYIQLQIIPVLLPLSFFALRVPYERIMHPPVFSHRVAAAYFF
jgi:hypothetical protein